MTTSKTLNKLKKRSKDANINPLNSPALTQVEAGVFLIIDGGNLYRKLKELDISKLSEFDYIGFAKKLSNNDKSLQCIYYVGQIREELNNPKSNELKSKQDRLFASLKKQGIIVKTGYILKSGSKYQEKGVDVQIAVDICMKAVRNEYKRLILVSSDTDLIPAIKEAKTLGKKVEYVGFDSRPSFALIRFSDSRTLLKREDLLPFVKKS